MIADIIPQAAIYNDPGAASTPQQTATYRNLQHLTDAIKTELLSESPLATKGKVLEVVGTLVRAVGIDVRVGELCELRSPRGQLLQLAEVVGFARDVALLSPFGRLVDISRETQVINLRRPLDVPVGDALLGRVIDCQGQPLDGLGPILCNTRRPIFADPPNPMTRPLLDTPLYTGVRVVDGLMTLGLGQRMGIFAPAGVGKSTLMGMFARGARCDLNVIALIGERGREVREFVEQILGPEGMARSVVVCATSDRSAIERAKAAYAATAIAEYFRDEGKSVLLMMDSLTRFARAQREIGLAAGEPPSQKGYTPSVFAMLPKIFERAGHFKKGSITGFFTVLVEGDDFNEPICDAVRGILDGHFILSRELGAAGHYPALDIRHSLSRLTSRVASPQQLSSIQKMREALALYHDSQDLIQLGAYAAGSNPKLDACIRSRPEIMSFLKQDAHAFSSFPETLERLEKLAVHLG